MHILIDARLYSPRFTGIGRYSFEIIKEFFKQKPSWKFTLLLAKKEFDAFTPPSENITKILADEKIYSIGEQTTFLQKLYSIDADLTWFPHFTVPYFYKRKFIVTVHDLTLSKFPGKKMNSFIHRMVYFAILRNALKNSKHILTVSENTKKDIVTDEKISSDKITIAHNAVGEEFLNFLTPKVPVSKKLKIDSKFFLYTGQHREHKNLHGMVKGFHKFLQETKEEYKLVITGKENPLYPEFWEYCKKHNLQEKVLTVGLVDENDLLALYQEATAYIFPSFYEGFGIPPLEAMALNTPVIASNASCIPEICGDAALYFTPSDSDELAKQMKKLTSDTLLQNTLIEKGRKQIQKYSWKSSAKKILKIFEKYE